MEQSISKSPLLNFVSIGPRTSLYTPENPRNGELVIICTWLGANEKHIAKFTSLYQKIAPEARILLIQSAVPILISSYAYQRNVIQPAVAVVQERLLECGQQIPYQIHKSSSTSGVKAQPKMILHMFSNGGTNTATQLLIVLRERNQFPLPLAGILCDSCPAKGTYWRSYHAMVLSLPKDIVSRIVGTAACHAILISLYSWIACGNENPASLQRRTLLDAETVQLGGPGEAPGRICYLFSKEDTMCQWEDIECHAQDAKKLNWQVEELIFEGSAHCAHLRKDEQRYFKAVENLWNGTGEVWRKSLAKL